MWNALALHNSIPEITRPRRVADYRVRHILPKPSFRFDQSKATGWRVLGAQSIGILTGHHISRLSKSADHRNQVHDTRTTLRAFAPSSRSASSTRLSNTS